MVKEIDYLDQRKAKKLIDSLSNKSHKAAFLLMMDCGLRVTECVTLKISNFDFRKKLLFVQSLKKRDEKHTRTIPISDRCYQALAEHISSLTDTSPDSYLFPGRNGGHINRKAMNRVCDRIKAKDPSFKNLHPHALRHTCATQLLSTGAKLHEIKEILGHKKYDTTLIYAHIPQEVLRERIDSMTYQKPTILSRVKDFFNPVKRATLINIDNPASFTIGRNYELEKVLDLVNKNVNTIILGSIGVGKTHIIDTISQSDRKILKFDDFSDIKKTLVSALIYLYENDKQQVFNIMFPEFDLDETRQHLQKDSVINLSKELIKVTQKHEYLLVIDNCDRITPRGIKVLELLKDHFTILTTARQVAVNKSSFLWNFEVLRLEPLNRQHSIELIHKLSYDMDIEDYELYRNHIYEQSNGNPRVVYELVERYRKEVLITSDVVRTIRHTGSLQEYDFSLVVLLGLGSLAILRYLSSEVGNDSLRFIGGCAMVLLIISRYFFSFTKKRYL